MLPPWVNFLIALVVIMILSKKDLGIGIYIGSIVLCLLSGLNFLFPIGYVLFSIKNLFLALKVI